MEESSSSVCETRLTGVCCVVEDEAKGVPLERRLLSCKTPRMECMCVCGSQDVCVHTVPVWV